MTKTFEITKNGFSLSRMKGNGPRCRSVIQFHVGDNLENVQTKDAPIQDGVEAGSDTMQNFFRNSGVFLVGSSSGLK